MEVANDIWLQKYSVCHSSRPGVKSGGFYLILHPNKYLIMKKPFNLHNPIFPIKKNGIMK